MARASASADSLSVSGVCTCGTPSAARLAPSCWAATAAVPAAGSPLLLGRSSDSSCSCTFSFTWYRGQGGMGDSVETRAASGAQLVCTAFSAGQRACCHRLQATPVQAPRHVRPQPCHSRCSQQQVAAAEPAAHILKLQHHVGIGGHKLGRSASAGRGRVCVAGLHTRTSVLFDARQALLKSPMLKSSRQQVCKSHACKRAASRMHAGTLDAQGITAGAPCPPVCMPAAASSFIDRSCSSRASFLSSPTTSCERGHGKKQREPNEQD